MDQDDDNESLIEDELNDVCDDTLLNNTISPDKLKNEQHAMRTMVQNTLHAKNPQNFQKLGTVLNTKIRKISILDQARRNTQCQNVNTQDIVENLTPFIMQYNQLGSLANKPGSPELTRFRAFSP